MVSGSPLEMAPGLFQWSWGKGPCVAGRWDGGKVSPVPIRKAPHKGWAEIYSISAGLSSRARCVQFQFSGRVWPTWGPPVQVKGYIGLVVHLPCGHYHLRNRQGDVCMPTHISPYQWVGSSGAHLMGHVIGYLGGCAVL